MIFSNWKSKFKKKKKSNEICYLCWVSTKIHRVAKVRKEKGREKVRVLNDIFDTMCVRVCVWNEVWASVFVNVEEKNVFWNPFWETILEEKSSSATKSCSKINVVKLWITQTCNLAKAKKSISPKQSKKKKERKRNTHTREENCEWIGNYFMWYRVKEWTQSATKPKHFFLFKRKILFQHSVDLFKREKPWLLQSMGKNQKMCLHFQWFSVR